MKKLIAAVLALIIIILSMSACKKDKDEIELYYPVKENFSTIDPQVAAVDSSKLIAYNCYEGLVRLNENGEIKPGMAKSWSVSSDSLKYIFNLRTDAKWYLTNTSKEEFSDKESKGTELKSFDERVTAKDFVFGIKRAVTPETGSPEGSCLSVIKGAAEALSGTASPDNISVKALNDFTLEITLERADPNFLYYLTRLPAMPCNESFFNACKGRYGLAMEYMLCNGAYMVYRWSAESFIRLEKNPLYTGEEKAKNDRVWVYYLADQSNLAERIKDEDYDAGFMTAQRAMPLLGKRSYTLVPRSDIIWGYWFNCADESFTISELRQAFASSCDLSVLNRPEYIEGKISRIITNAVTPFYDYAPKGLEYNEDNAREYYQKAAKRSETVSNGMTVTVLTCEDFADSVRKQIQIWQRVFGLDIKIKIETRENAVALMNSGKYQIAFLPLLINTSNTADLLGMFKSDSANNTTGYFNVNYDSLISSLTDSMTQEEQAGVFKSCEQSLITYAVVIPVYTEATYFIMGKNVHGMYSFSQNEVYFRNSTIQ